MLTYGKFEQKVKGAPRSSSLFHQFFRIINKLHYYGKFNMVHMLLLISQY